MIGEKSNPQNQRYRHLDDAPMPVLVASGEDLVVDYANAKAWQLIKRQRRDATDLRLFALLPEIFSIETVSTLYKRCVLEGARHLLSEEQHSTSHRYTADSHPIRDDAGRPSGVIIFLSEVTDQAQSGNVRPDEAGKPIGARKAAKDPAMEFNRTLELKVRERTAALTKMNDLLQSKVSALNDTQAILQQLVDSTIEHIAVVSKDLKFLFVNKPLEKFLNKPRSEVVGKHVLEEFQGARGSGQLASLTRALAGEVVHLRLNPSISRPDVWFDTHFVPLVIDDRIEGATILSRDISEIVRSEQALAHANRQLAEAQRLAKLGSWEWDVESGDVLWSDEMYRIYGYDEQVPMDFVRATERMSPEDAERSSRRTQQHIQLATDQFRQSGERVMEISPIEFPITLPDGTQKTVRNSGKIQLTPEGKLHRVLGIVQDVTHVRSTELQLRLLVSELELKNKDLESFNYVASHDLQEPLRKIQTFIDLIRNGPPCKKTMEDYLLRIHHSAERMHALIQSMLMLSRLSSPTDGFTDVDLNVVLANCQSDLELMIKEKHAEIESDRLPVVVASAFQMSQLFANLISNALKFSEGAVRIEITCKRVSAGEMKQAEAEEGRAYWCISFVDNGIGFDPSHKEEIFGLFQRLHSKKQFAGSGIGLSIVKRIVERHRGFIEANSEPGKGAAFSVWLPG